nr:hypothetical protein [Synechococcus sp. PCC 7335]
MIARRWCEALFAIWRLTGEFAFDADFKVAFGGAFGEDGQSGFTADLRTRFWADVGCRCPRQPATELG